MDKIQVALEVVRKYHFWILYGLILVMGLASWYLASGAVANDFQTSKGEIEQDFTAVQQVQSAPDHPNQKCVDRWNELTKAHAATVLKGWETLYDQQENDNKLYDQLSPECRELFQCTTPVINGNRVSYTVRSGGQLIQRNVDLRDFEDYLSEYQREIRDYVRTRWNIIDVRKVVQSESPASEPGTVAHGTAPGPLGADGSKAAKATYTGLVECSSKDREAFERRFDWTHRPEYYDVRLAQEDLWVYEALLGIIRDTNEGYSDANYHEAPIKRIDALEIGQLAAASWQREMGGAAVRSTSGPGHASSSGAPNSLTVQSLLQNRYVDNNVLPLSAGPNGEVQHPYKQFKIMPIRMQLLMNQLKINKLLMLCANSFMPIEVKSVRLNPGMGGTINPAAGGTGAGQPAQPERGTGEGARTTDGASDMTEPHDLDVTVEIQGVICIYEPPNKELLGTGTDVTDADPAAATTPIDPAATPAVGDTTPPAGPTPGTPETTPPVPEPTPPGPTPNGG